MTRTAAILILATAAGYAQAQPPAKLLAGVEVRYADLDLTSADDAAVMMSRIERAATQVCRFPFGTPVQRQCVARTVANAVAELNAPAVSKRYADARH